MELNLNFQPHDGNPFRKPRIYRVQPIADDQYSVYDLLVRNFIAFVYYNNYRVVSSFDIDVDYYQRSLKLRYFDFYKDSNLFALKRNQVNSPLMDFIENEIFDFAEYSEQDAVNYVMFINKNKSVFQSIAKLMDYRIDVTLFDSDVQNIIIKSLLSNLEEGIVELSKKYRLTLTQHILTNLTLKLHLNDVNLKELNPIFSEMQHATSNEFISEVQRYRLKKLFLRVIRQVHKDINFRLHPLSISFEELESHFLEITEFNQTNSEEQDFPRYVFKTYEAYQLFHDYAQRMDIKTSVNYLYRRMHEKDNLILLKDTEFRAWFNDQDYQVKFYDSTLTFSRSHNPERQVLIDMLYEKYGIKQTSKITEA